MKLTILIITVFLLQVSASTSAQITLKETNAPLQKLLKSISLQSGYDFVYSSLDFKNLKPVTITLNNVTVEKALEATFQGQPLIYEISDKTVMVKRKEEKQASIIDKIKNYFATINIRGRVVDEKFEPLQGASVSVKNGKGAVNTDANGFFYLKNVDENATIIFTYLGYSKKEIEVNGKEDFGDVPLQQSSSKLDEVQVQAYGTTSKRISTSNITTVKAEEIARQPINNPLFALMGRVPGLIVTPTSGLPGAPVKVQLRGQNSLSDVASEPMYVIDGVPFVNTMAGNQRIDHGVPQIGAQPGLENISALSFINPNDIESIDVLKDADATAIYGSRGANGVILITTKKGHIGKTQVDASFTLGFARVPKQLQMMNTQQYLEMRKEMYRNDGMEPPSPTMPDGDKNISNYDLSVWDPNRYTDWQDVLLGNTGKSYTANLAISGGNQGVQYRVAGMYDNSGYVFPGSNNNTNGNLQFNITGSSANQKFRISLSGSYAGSNSEAVGDFTRLALLLPPNAPALYNADGQLNWEPNPNSPTHEATWVNPFAQLLKSSTTKSNTLTSNIDINYNILNNLKFTTQLGYSKVWFNSFSPDPISSRDPSTFGYATGSAVRNDNSTDTWSIAPQLNFTTQILRGKLNVLLGGSLQGANQESQYLLSSGYTNDALLGSLLAGSIPDYGQSNTSSQYKYTGIFSRLNYNWEDKYILNIAGRRDGSSRFGPGNQFGNFGSVGLAWIFTNEKIIKDKTGILSYGKLRSSYGTNGNDQIGDYQFLEFFKPGPSYQGARGLYSSGATNPDFHWESKMSLELGFDLGFFKDNILLSGSYFRSRSSNQLVNYPLAATAGTASINLNSDAKIQNTGMEVSMSANIFATKEFRWTTTANVSFLNKNKLLALPKQAVAPLRLQSIYNAGTDPVGKPFAGIIAVYEFRGVNPDEGFYTFTKEDGSVTQTAGDAFSANRYAKTITTAPQYYGGISNQFTYKNISLYFFIQFTKQKGRNPLYDTAFGLPGTLSEGNGNLPVSYETRWKNPGDMSSIQRLSQDFSSYFSLSALNSSDAAWVDASFIRFKTISLSYQLPESIVKKARFNSINLFANIQNLFTITGYKGADPETQSVVSLPPLKQMNVGVRIGL